MHRIGVRNDVRLFIAVLVAIFAGVLLLPLLGSFHPDLNENDRPLLFIPAVLLTVVTILPAIVSMRVHGRRFDLLHPLFYAAWFFFIPQFAVTSFLLAFGNLDTLGGPVLSSPVPERLAALAAAALGSIGLSIGYFLPFGKLLGRMLPEFQPLNYRPERVKLAAFILMTIGVLAQLGAFRSGLLGYQFNLDVPVFGATFASFSDLLLISQGMIWYSFFKERRGWRALAFLQVGVMLLGVVISGSRATVFHSALVVAVAYLYTRERLKTERLWIWGVVLGASLFVGMVFGSYFRIAKTETVGRTTSVSAQDVVGFSQAALQAVANQPLPEVIQFGWSSIVERIDGITYLSVILANADRLKDAEVAAQIDHNIARDFMTSFVPRFLWKDKPVVGVSEEIGQLYFNTQFNSPATTYMGDLYRNWGWWGIIPGMVLIGIVLRCLYVWLIESHSLSPMRVGVFISLSLVVNYESLYSIYFPGLIRAVFVVLVAIAIAKVLRRGSVSRQLA